MTNKEMLENKIKGAGLKKKFVAQCCGLTSQGFQNCLTGKSAFRITHVKTLMNLLNLSPAEVIEIFFTIECA